MSGYNRVPPVPVPGRVLSDVGHRNLLLCPRDSRQDFLHHGQQVYVQIQEKPLPRHSVR